jgi:phospholipase/carboxylesterase
MKGDIMNSDFTHIFHAGAPDKPVLLLLHGTGADEHDLVGLGQSLVPDWSILSPRGRVQENGMNRFFKRFADGSFDLDDLHARTAELVNFITEARAHYHIAERPIYTLGYSNGANIAANILLTHSTTLDGAVLLRALLPDEPTATPDLQHKKILLLAGLFDQMIPTDKTERLAALLQQAHADLTFITKPATHGLTQSDMESMQEWFATL